jgi:uncharacterized membrane protein YhaH (DUF805 family)
MRFGDAVSTCFGKYATFGGRAMRSEFWYFVLFLFLLQIVAGIVDRVLQGDDTGPVSLIVSLATVLPSLAAGCRRLHDTERSGWWQLLALIPIIGTIVLIVWFATRGTAGPNRYGEEPVGAARG